MKKKFFFLTVLITMAIVLFPAPKAQAIDPVTIAILAPIALQLANQAKPYLIKGAANLLKGMMYCGKDLIDFFRLPLGMFQASIGAPFGQFAPGVKNMILGGIAPFKLGFHVMLLPLFMLGLNLNM